MASPLMDTSGEFSENWKREIRASSSVKQFLGSWTSKAEEASKPEEEDVSDDDLPALFEGKKGGREAWSNTKKWRALHKAADVLKEPQPHCQKIKKLYPHYFHGKSPEGDARHRAEAISSRTTRFDGHSSTRVERQPSAFVSSNLEQNRSRYSPSAQVLVFELLGKLDNSVDMTSEALERHFTFVHEYLSDTVAGEDTRIVTILDAGGLGWF